MGGLRINKISLRKLSEEEYEVKYLEKIGLSTDDAYEIINIESDTIGIVLISNSNPHFGYECTFIDWVEIYPEYQRNGYFPYVLSELFSLYRTTEIHFESCEENLNMYLHLGAVDTGISDLTENHKMILKQKDFDQQLFVTGKTNFEVLMSCQTPDQFIRMYEKTFGFGCMQSIAQKSDNDKDVWKTHCLLPEYRGMDGCERCKREFWDKKYECRA